MYFLERMCAPTRVRHIAIHLIPINIQIPWGISSGRPYYDTSTDRINIFLGSFANSQHNPKGVQV